eukprot:NODE_27097_length_526_cov_2.067669.p2 GENE.NODE_27097_length_526_cov_2.067669~~NODE_27097_length_526_cov_2.067669.p2  ORF type:complete len:79 (+),score=25.00 NODE_27097_length_526_cov_2.067669:231-467(+)
MKLAKAAGGCDRARRGLPWASGLASHVEHNPWTPMLNPFPQLRRCLAKKKKKKKKKKKNTEKNKTIKKKKQNKQKTKT